MLSYIFLTATAIVSAFKSLLARFYPKIEHLSLIREIEPSNEPIKALQTMIEIDGAGAWPPKASYRESWPVVLHPYHDIFVVLAPLLPVIDVSLDSTINQCRRMEYQQRLRILLKERVNLGLVKETLSAAADETSCVITNQQYNGFYACISYLRHAFRWGTIPIVEVAQQEKIIDFPPELDLPWDFIRQKYGITSLGGNVTSNFFCNLDRDRNKIEYAINGSMPEPIPSAEYYLIYAFTEPERKALPVYYHLVQSITCFERDQKHACVEHLQSLTVHLRAAFRVYYEYVIDSKIPHSVFTAYIQGFHGWAAGEMIDDKYMEYDGTSGANLVLFNVLDFFLGLEPFLAEQDYVKYFSSSQRRFLTSIKTHAFRAAAEQANDVDLVQQFDYIGKQLRVWFHTDDFE
ncbi:hypothetical protein PDIG_45940 [Penicillium digitatum PHI26]|uniref:Indoleamine 2,3-dioxygenase n=2 Tax=Penicillium digitatum TaxID=36651 RepID=K9FT20_PEND2|nr:hypothetical protein PDIP_17870 [Penicillium digitatum Pd1]EKV12269.1 hypothetical protein PDIG_45940 [Penicillium digitatum PHI26]EKV20306.1 hypothetical protein PDIP_17870 [Penicillium digitatum Pd1]